MLWWLADDEHLPAQAAVTIADPGTEVFVPAASAWEISIKLAAGRLDAPVDFVMIEGLTLVSVDRRFSDYGVEPLRLD